LASFPGPLLARCTRIWYVYHLLTGRLPFAVQQAHEKYGRIVRLAPNELSFTDPDAWKSIYGYNTGATGGEMLKDPDMYGNTSGAALSIFAAPSDRHRNLRRLLSHGFSEKALRSQETIIQYYLDFFIRRLRDLGAKGEVVDIVTWYNVSILLSGLLSSSRPNILYSSLPSTSSVTWALQSHSTA
jgi:cytochrome P450